MDRLRQAKIGRPLLLGETLDQQVQAYLCILRDSGEVINTSIAIAVDTGIAQKKDNILLAASGGHIALTKHWAQYLIQRMGFIKRKSTTKVKVFVEDLEALKEQFLLDIKAIVDLEDIPHELILNGPYSLLVCASYFISCSVHTRFASVLSIDCKWRWRCRHF